MDAVIQACAPSIRISSLDTGSNERAKKTNDHVRFLFRTYCSEKTLSSRSKKVIFGVIFGHRARSVEERAVADLSAHVRSGRTNLELSYYLFRKSEVLLPVHLRKAWRKLAPSL
jgi:hypothetical protein